MLFFFFPLPPPSRSFGKAGHAIATIERFLFSDDHAVPTADGRRRDERRLTRFFFPFFSPSPFLHLLSFSLVSGTDEEAGTLRDE